MRNATAQPDNLVVTDFEEYLNQNRIKSIDITPVGGENEELVTISGIYTDANGKDLNYYFIIDRELFYKDYYDLAKSNGVVITHNKLSSTNWLSILSFLIPIVLFIGFMVFLFRNNASGNNKAFDFGKSRARINRQSKVSFKDVAGVDEEKQELEEVIDFLKYPRKYFEIGARIPKGILLVGPPGTGKTLLAKAVAGEAKVPFYSISGSDFVEMFVGVGASRVRDMFKTAKQNAPCIVFIDEIDAVGRQRGAGLGGGHDEREQTLNQLLVEMDGFEENSGVIVMAATNRVDVLDPALLRPGRFDRQIRISNPDVRGRTDILKVHARNKKLSPKVNLEDIARRTPGFSGADLENLLNESALLAAREGRKEIRIYDIDEAIDRVLMGPAKRSRKYSDTEKRIVAYHEAGHAIIGLKLDNADIVQKVTIVPRGEAGGYNLMTPEEERFLQTKNGLLDTITGLLGGRVSEELMTNEITTGAHNDFQKATQIARAMVTEYGMSKLGPIQYEKSSYEVFLGRDYMKDKNFSDQVALEIDQAIREIIDDCYKRAQKVLTDNKDTLILIANHLMEIETLTKEDIYELVNTGKLAWWEKKKAKAEAERIAQEKEEELQEIYRKQLKAMEEAKKAAETNKEPEEDKKDEA
ncbi:MAG: ATP-dependent zinc metalloprotease FtsH [Acholeplasmataceae bacterium]|nr:ATP-dependent zinc metalloprotease FtsH [Acholeplasmataceae bacterium]